MKKTLCCILCVIFICIGLTSCKQNIYPLSSTQLMMDTVISIKLFDGDSDALDGAVSLCKRYDMLFSKTVATSDVYKLNHAGGQPVTVEDDTAYLLEIAVDISEKSNGAFDPTVLPLVSLWDVTNSEAPPKDSHITAALKSVDYKNIIIDGNTVTLLNGATVDLGGIAKGFIADKVKEYLKAKGVESAIINLGGNIMLIGNKDGEDFSVGIQKPFGKENELSATACLTDKTAVTSGIYQRYFEANGKIYHHIINPESGYPTDNGIAAVTVIAESSAIADGLSTACLNLGATESAALLKQYGAEAIFITTDGELILTDGLTQSIDKGDITVSLKQ